MAPKQLRRGLSLLELVLALALSVVVIGLVSMAMRIQLQSFENRRDRIDQASLGRAILRHIADDLRCAIANRPIDLQGVSTVTGNASAGLGLPDTGAEPDSGGQGTNTTSASGADAAADSQATDSTAEGTSGAAKGQAAYVAGLYGDQYSVQFDMTRLPRLDEYSSIVSDIGINPIAQIPTDIRTVSYYLAGSTPMTQASSAMSRETGIMPLNQNMYQDPSQAPQAQGLMRQERDRAVASYSEVSVDYSDWTSDTGEELLAEEVTRLEFQYYDGYEWTTSWDSEDRGGLPVAIEIVVGLLDRKVSEDEEAASTPSTSGVDTTTPRELYYRLVVRIPTGEPLDPYAVEEAPVDPSANADAATDTAADSQNAATPMTPMGGAAPGAAPPAGAPPGFGPGGGPGGQPGAGPGGGGRGGRGGGQNGAGQNGGGRGGAGGGQRGGGGAPGGGGQRGGGGRAGGPRGGGS